MSEVETPLERPPLSITLGETTVKMTYGLEMDLRRLLPDPQAAMMLVLNDPFTQDYLVRRCLTAKRQIITKDEDLITPEEVDLDPEQVDELLLWATAHVLYFFVKRTTGMADLGVRFGQALPNPSKSGSEASPSLTPSVGLSE